MPRRHPSETEPRLYHVSETAGIRKFEPRVSLDGSQLVWAIEQSRVHNYLLPRDCPRVTFYALPDSTAEDCERLLGRAGAVVAIELSWQSRARETALSLYELPAAGFELKDRIAGYHVSRSTVTPLREMRLVSALAALEQQPVEIRLLPCLWALREAVAGSSLGFSIIRFRNAAPAPEGFRTRYPVPPPV